MTNGKIRLIALIGAFSAAIGGVSVASGVETEAEEGKTQVQASVSPDTSLHQDSQYFEEVFFGLGENVKRLQQNIDNAAYDRVVAAPPNEPSARTEYEQVAEWFVEQVEERQPGFFKEFNQDITSGDPFVVENAVAEAVTLINDVTPVEEVGGDDLVSGFCLVGPAVFAFAVWDAAAAVNYAGLVNVYAAVLVSGEVELAESRNALAGESGEIAKQDMVAGITKTYAGTQP